MRNHLETKANARGFASLPAIPSNYGGEARIYESSNASGPHIWLDATCPADLNRKDGPTVEASLHLTAESAWQLAEQLMTLVAHHYQGDARPRQRAADLHQ